MRKKSTSSPTSRWTSPSRRDARVGATTPGASGAVGRAWRARPMIIGIPLAWLQLKREKLRLAVAVAGVAFAVILIFMQLGFRKALFDSSTRLHQAFAGDLFLISPQFDFIAQPKSFSHRRLLQALGYPGVAAVSPVYLGITLWKNPDTGKTRLILVTGIDPSDEVLSLPGVREQRELIRLPDVVLYDRAGRPEF